MPTMRLPDPVALARSRLVVGFFFAVAAVATAFVLERPGLLWTVVGAGAISVHAALGLRREIDVFHQAAVDAIVFAIVAVGLRLPLRATVPVGLFIVLVVGVVVPAGQRVRRLALPAVLLGGALVAGAMLPSPWTADERDVIAYASQLVFPFVTIVVMAALLRLQDVAKEAEAELRNRDNELAALRRIGLAAIEGDLDEGITAMQEEYRSLTGFRHVFIQQIAGDVLINSGRIPGYVAGVFPLADAIFTRPAVESGEPNVFYAPDCVAPCEHRYGWHSALSIPVSVGGDTVGAVTLTDPDPIAVTEADLHGAEILAIHVHSLLAERRARDSLAIEVREKDAFLASVSHEIRTPLTVVLGMASELAAGSVPDDEQADVLRLIVDQSVEVSTLVEDLLVAARADLGSVSIYPEPCQMRDVVEEVLRTLALEGPPPVVTGSAHASADPLRLRQVLRNLLGNANRYGGDQIRIELAERHGWAEAVVIDDGVGIPRERLDVFFSGGYLPGADDGRPGSIGLGLRVSRDLAELMGGALHYERRDGETRFRLTLPPANG